MMKQNTAHFVYPQRLKELLMRVILTNIKTLLEKVRVGLLIRLQITLSMIQSIKQ